jgi:HK97 family phage major capsid protein
MARATFEAWIPEEYGSDVLVALSTRSAMEALAGPAAINMTTDTRHVPRSADVSVSVIPKGSAYPEDVAAVDEVLLYVTKFGTAVRIADEDLADAPENIIGVKQMSWSRAFAVELDNACLAVTAGPGVKDTTVPFTSIYYAVRHNDTGASYTADANYLSLSNGSLSGTAAGAKSGLYSAGSSLLALLEGGKFWDESSVWIIAHPAFKALIRNVRDDQNRPIWTEGQGGAADTLFGYNVKWSLGAKTSAVATSSPAGNPLMIVGNTAYLRYGKRSGPESMIIPGDTGLGALTDETILKMRARRAFVPGNPAAFAVLELVA